MKLFRLQIFIIITLLIINSSIAKDIYSIIKIISNIDNIPPHIGEKVKIYYKDNKKYVKKEKISFLSLKEFKILATSPANQKGSVFACDGEKIIGYFPPLRMKMEVKFDDKKEIRMPDKGNETFSLDIDYNKLIKNYEVKIIGGDKINNRDTNIILIKSKRNKYCHSRKIFVDKEKYFILREERYYNNNLYYSFYFENIEYRSPTDEELKIEVPTLAIPMPIPKNPKKPIIYNSINEAKKKIKNIPLLIEVPKEFTIDEINETQSFGQAKDLNIHYSDGLVGISINKSDKGVFLKFLKLLGSKMDNMIQDAENYSPFYYYKIEKDNERIIIKGEMPEEILKKMAPYKGDK